MANQIEIAKLSIDLDAAVQGSRELAAEIERVKAAQKALRDEGKTTSTEFVKNEAALKNLNKSYRDSQKLTSALLDVNQDLNKALQVEGKSNLELLDSRRQLNEIVKSISGNTEDEIKLRAKLNKAIDEQTAAIREQSSDFNASKDRIGEYKQAIEGAIPANSLLGQTIAGARQVLQTFNPLYKAASEEIRTSVDGIRNAAKGTEDMTKAQKAQVIITNVASNSLKLFRAALISTGIGAIVVALGSLVAYLSSTQEGIDKVNSVLKPLEVIFKRLFGIFQEVGKALFDAFSNPKQLISDIGDAIKNNLLVRFEALKRILERIINFDFKGIGEDLSQAATGVENIGEKTAAFFEKAKGFIEDSVRIGKELAELQIEIEENENRLILKRAELRTEYEKEKEVAQDVNKSYAERRQAAEAAIAAQNALLADEQEQLDRRIKQKEIENSLNDTSREDQKELNELIAQRTEFEADAARKRVSAANLVKTIDREAAAAAIKAEKERADQIKANATAAVANAKLELEIFKEKNREVLAADGQLNQARIDAALAAEKYLRDEALVILNEKVQKGLATEQEAALERLQILRAYNDAETALNDEFAKQRQAEYEKQAKLDEDRRKTEEEARFELRQLQADDEFEFRQMQLERKRNQEIQEAERLGADITDIVKKYNLLQQKLDIDRRKASTAEAQQQFGQFGDLAKAFFGENKALSAALALGDTFLGAQKAYLSQLIPGDPTSLGRAIGAAIQATAFGLANVAKVSGVKFARGGALQMIGGQRHSAGGTKFVGEDGTRFEAERGELIGVMSRPAAKAFLAFNRLFRGGKSGPGYYAGGGVFGAASAFTQSGLSRGIQAAPSISQGIDVEALGYAAAQAAAAMPAPILVVSDFHDVNDKVVNVQSGANV